MLKRALHIVVMILAVHTVQAQYVQFEDTLFRNYIRDYYPAVYKDSLDGMLDIRKANNKTANYVNGEFDAAGFGFNRVDEIIHLGLLDTIFLSNNNLRHINGIRNLGSLDYLDISHNQFDSLPELYRIDVIKYIDASHNNIQYTPKEMNWRRDSITHIDLSHNVITEFKGFGLKFFKVLEYANISYNYLTWEDLLPLPTWRDYSTAYTVFPQKDLPLETTQFQLTEGIKDSILIPIDTNLTGITYSLINTDGQTVAVSNNGYFSWDLVPMELNGQYHVVLTTDDPNFTGQWIRTVNFEILVSPCFTFSQLQIQEEEVDCDRKIVHFEFVNGPENYSGIVSTGEHLMSGSNLVLANGEYSITFYASSGCKLDSTFNFTLVKDENCEASFNLEDPVLTPNHDGVQDVVYLDGSGTAVVYNKAGQIMTTLSLPITWDGRNESGTLLQPGYYLIVKNSAEKQYITIQY